MLDKEKMNRINELALAAKKRKLNEKELAEQAALRAEYLKKFRSQFKAHLDNIKIED